MVRSTVKLTVYLIPEPASVRSERNGSEQRLHNGPYRRLETDSMNMNEEERGLLFVWEELWRIFRQMRVFIPKREDVATSTETWKSDHVTLNLQSLPWSEAAKLIRPLPTESLLSLIELSKVHSTHINKHLAVAIGLVTAPAFLLSVVKALQALLQALGLSTRLAPLLQDMGLRPTAWPIEIKAFVVVVGYFTVLIFVLLGAIQAVSFWRHKWRAMELTTCLQTMLAIRSATEDGDADVRKAAHPDQ